MVFFRKPAPITSIIITSTININITRQMMYQNGTKNTVLIGKVPFKRRPKVEKAYFKLIKEKERQWGPLSVVKKYTK